MHLVVDAVAVGTGSSAIVIENLLNGWRQEWPDDQITVLSGPDGPVFTVPDGAATHCHSVPRMGLLGGLWLRSVGVRRAARILRADAVLSGVPASGLLGAHCTRGVILYDLRHELRPEQFTRLQLLARRISWQWSMRRADGIYCISERTLGDLRARHPRLASRGVAAVLGSEHAANWSPGTSSEPSGPYALAFGHFANKNVAAVLEGWASFCRAHPDWRLRLVGMGQAARVSAADIIDRLGISDGVELMPWLDDQEFAACFAGAGLVVFPSDFEGFGLPAVEAMRLGIPVVISTDAALAEVTGGYASTARSVSADDLCAAMEDALTRTPAECRAGRQHAAGYSWTGMARVIRASLTRQQRVTGS